MRPTLVAGGLGLLWYVQVQQEVGIEGDVPDWGLALIIATRLLVDFVGAWAIVSVVQLTVVAGRLLLACWRQHQGVNSR
jgi:hypothetical protein